MTGAESDPDSGTRFDVLIVGAGHAGVHVAATLAGSFEGSIGLLSAERREPYERPPLTKAFLVGDVTASSGYRLVGRHFSVIYRFLTTYGSVSTRP